MAHAGHATRMSICAAARLFKKLRLARATQCIFLFLAREKFCERRVIDVPKAAHQLAIDKLVAAHAADVICDKADLCCGLFRGDVLNAVDYNFRGHARDEKRWCCLHFSPLGALYLESSHTRPLSTFSL